MVKCPTCSNEYDDGVTLCANCGSFIESAPSADAEDSEIDNADAISRMFEAAKNKVDADNSKSADEQEEDKAEPEPMQYIPPEPTESTADESPAEAPVVDTLEEAPSESAIDLAIPDAELPDEKINELSTGNAVDISLTDEDYGEYAEYMEEEPPGGDLEPESEPEPTGPPIMYDIKGKEIADENAAPITPEAEPEKTESPAKKKKEKKPKKEKVKREKISKEKPAKKGFSLKKKSKSDESESDEDNSFSDSDEPIEFDMGGGFSDGLDANGNEIVTEEPKGKKKGKKEKKEKRRLLGFIPAPIFRIVLLVLISAVSLVIGGSVVYLQVDKQYAVGPYDIAYQSVAEVMKLMPKKTRFIAYDVYVKETKANTECIINGVISPEVGEYIPTYYRLLYDNKNKNEATLFQPFDEAEYNKLLSGDDTQQVEAEIMLHRYEVYKIALEEINAGSSKWKKVNTDYINLKINE